MKTIDEILEELDLDENSTVAELLEKLTLVTINETNDIKSISVKPLPNVVRDKAEELKNRFVNTTIDDEKGMTAVLNKRVALLYTIITLLKNKDTTLEDTLEDLEDTVDTKADRNNNLQSIVAKDITLDDLIAKVIENANGNTKIRLNDGSILLLSGNNGYGVIIDDDIIKIGDSTGEYWEFNGDTLKLKGTSHQIESNSGKSYVLLDDDTIEVLSETGTNNNSSLLIKPDFIKFVLIKNSNLKNITISHDKADFEIPLYQGNNKVLNTSDVIDMLTSNTTNVPLSANQGKVLNQTKLDKAAVYNGLDKVLEGFALDARQGKVLKDLVDTLYDYVGYATQDDSNTTVDRLREIFEFLSGASDDETLLAMLNAKADLTNENQDITANSLKAKVIGDTNVKTTYDYTSNIKTDRVENPNDSDNYAYNHLSKDLIETYWRKDGYRHSRMDVRENEASFYTSTLEDATQYMPKRASTSFFGILNYPYMTYSYYENDVNIVNDYFYLNYDGFRVAVNSNELKIDRTTNKFTYNNNEVIDTNNATTELFLTDAEMTTLLSEVFD